MTDAEIGRSLDRSCDQFAEALEAMIRFRAFQVSHLGESQGITERQSVESALHLTAVKLRGLATLLEERVHNYQLEHRPTACRRPARSTHA